MVQRFYEVMFIVRPDVLEEEVDKLIAGLEATITAGGGAIRSTEKLGRRKLAYTVRKFNDGNYILLTVDADGKLIAEVERRLRVIEQVIKFITVRMDEETSVWIRSRPCARAGKSLAPSRSPRLRLRRQQLRRLFRRRRRPR